MAEGGVVVQRDLAVQSQDGAVGGGQRVDFHQGGVLGGEDLPQPGDDVGDAGGGEPGLEAGRLDDARGDFVRYAGQGVDGDAGERLGTLLGEGFDVHAAFARAHGQIAALGAVQENGDVEFGIDVGAGADQDRTHRMTFDVHSEDLAGPPLGLEGAAGELDSAGLAAAARLDLGFDDDQRRTGVEQAGGDLTRLLGGCSGRAVEHRHPVRSEQVSRLILIQIHTVHPSGSACSGPAVDLRAQRGGSMMRVACRGFRARVVPHASRDQGPYRGLSGSGMRKPVPSSSPGPRRQRESRDLRCRRERRARATMVLRDASSRPTRKDP